MKFCAWEDYWSDKVMDAREVELEWVAKCTSFLLSCLWSRFLTWHQLVWTMHCFGSYGPQPRPRSLSFLSLHMLPREMNWPLQKLSRWCYSHSWWRLLLICKFRRRLHCSTCSGAYLITSLPLCALRYAHRFPLNVVPTWLVFVFQVCHILDCWITVVEISYLNRQKCPSTALKHFSRKKRLQNRSLRSSESINMSRDN